MTDIVFEDVTDVKVTTITTDNDHTVLIEITQSVDHIGSGSCVTIWSRLRCTSPWPIALTGMKEDTP